MNDFNAAVAALLDHPDDTALWDLRGTYADYDDYLDAVDDWTRWRFGEVL